MKKTIYFLFLITLLSCSKSDDSNNNNNPNDLELLVSSISYSDTDNSDYKYVESFTYDGNKIVEMKRSVYYNGNFGSENRSEFIYANDKISRVDYYDYENSIQEQVNFTYDSQGRLVAREYCYNSPFKNITGATPTVILQRIFSNSYLYSFNNNCLSVVSDEDGETYTLNFTYDYNDLGYPRNVVVEEVGYGETTITIEYVD